jgi:hypothetical protein
MASEDQSSNLDGRHRNANGEIDRKHGNTLVGTLRETYGEDFAAGHRADMKLSTLLRESSADLCCRRRRLICDCREYREPKSRSCRKPDFSGLGIRNLLDGNGECSGVDGRAASSGDGEGVGSGGGVEGLGTGGPATAAGTSAGDDGD